MGGHGLFDNETVCMRECVASDQFLATSALNYRLACDIQPTAVISVSRTLSLTHIMHAHTQAHTHTHTHTHTGAHRLMLNMTNVHTNTRLACMQVFVCTQAQTSALRLHINGLMIVV